MRTIDAPRTLVRRIRVGPGGSSAERGHRPGDQTQDYVKVRHEYQGSAEIELSAYRRSGPVLASCRVRGHRSYDAPDSYEPWADVEIGAHEVWSEADRAMAREAESQARADLLDTIREGGKAVARFLEAIQEASPYRVPVLAVEPDNGAVVLALDPDDHPKARFGDLELQLLVLVPRRWQSDRPLAERELEWVPVDPGLTFIERMESGASRWRIAGEGWESRIPDPASGFLWAEVR
jgi:hypothetical protein